MSTLGSMTTVMVGANLAAGDRFIVRDISDTSQSLNGTDKYLEWDELISGLSGFFPELIDGKIVGPILLTNYADVAAVTTAIGTPPTGYLLSVGNKLHLGDNAAAGGVRVTGARPSYHDVNATGSITVDPYASHTSIKSVMVNSTIAVTITNLADIPNGHLIFLYVEKTGTADQISINDGVLDAFIIGSILSSLIIQKTSAGWIIIQNVSV